LDKDKKDDEDDFSAIEEIVKIYDDDMQVFIIDAVEGVEGKKEREILKRVKIEHLDDALWRVKKVVKEQGGINNYKTYFQKALISSVVENGIKNLFL
jgi:hypothetical protein